MQITSSNASIVGAHADSFTSDLIHVGGRQSFDVCVEWDGTGSPVGDMIVEGGLDAATMSAITSPVELTYAVASGSPIQFVMQLPPFPYIRLKWTRTSGTLTITVARVEIY